MQSSQKLETVFYVKLYFKHINVPYLLDSQGRILKHIAEAIDPLVQVYQIDRLTPHVESLIQLSSKLQHLSNQDLLCDTLRSSIFENTECRQRVLPLIVEYLQRLFDANLDRVSFPFIIFKIILSFIIVSCF